MARLPADGLDDPLPRLAQRYGAAGQVGTGRENAEEVAGRRVIAEQEVRAGQQEEVQRVVVHETRELEQLAQCVRDGRDLGAEQVLGRLDRREVMADGA